MLGEDGFLLVQHALFSAILIQHSIKHPHVPQVHGILDDPVGVAPVRAVLGVSDDIVEVNRFVGDIPGAREWNELGLNPAAKIVGRVQKLMHKVGDVAGGNPRRAEAHADLVGFQVLGNDGLQRLYVGLEAFAALLKLHGCLSRFQFLPDVAGQIFVRGLPLFVGTGIADGVLVDETRQLVDEPVLVHAGKVRHEVQINHRALRHADRQRLRGGVHMVDGATDGDGAPGEHIRLALQLVFVVQYLQGGQQVVAVILAEDLCILPAGQKTVLLCVVVVTLVQLDLQGADHLIVSAGELGLDQLPCGVPQGNHAAHPALIRRAQGLLFHPFIPPVIDLAVLNGIGEVGYGGVGGNPAVVLRRRVHGALHILPLNVLDGVGKLLGQLRTWDGVAGGVLFTSVHAVVKGHRAQQHIRVFKEVRIDRHAVFIRADVNPRGLNIYRLLALLQEEDVCGNVRAGVGLEGRVGQANRAEQLRTLGDIPADGRILLVHRALAGDEGHDAARTYLVQRLGKEVIVDSEVVLVVSGIGEGIRTEGDVAYGGVEEAVGEGGALKALHADLRFGVQLLRDASRDAVQLHAGQLAVPHGLRQHTEEVAHAAGRLQDVAASEAEIIKALVDGTDDCGAGVVGVQGGGPRRFILIFRQQGFQRFTPV